MYSKTTETMPYSTIAINFFFLLLQQDLAKYLKLHFPGGKQEL